MRCPSCGAKCKSGLTHCPKCRIPLDPKVAAFGGAARGVREAWGLGAQEQTAVASAGRPSRNLIFVIAALVLVTGLLVALLLLQTFSAEPRQRHLNAENFADETLAALLADFDANGDGTLTAAEAAAVTELDCSGMGLHTLTGIELFVNLVSLDASDNALAALDLSGLDHLERVDVSDNAIGELNLAGHTSLTYLDASDNAMTALDVTGCSALRTLSCTGNSIARLDLSGCTALVDLSCDAGQNVTVPLSAGFFPDEGLRAALGAFDADGDGALTQRERQAVTSLAVDDPQTRDLQGLAWFESLERLDISGTAVASLDASELPSSLTALTARGCAIVSTDLGGLSRLAALDLAGNPLTSIDLAGLGRLSALDLSDCALAGTLDVTSNFRLTTLKVSGNPKLIAIDARGITGLAADGAIACDASCTVVFANPEEPENASAPTDSTTPVDETAPAGAPEPAGSGA